jgi:hypothetical protein
MGCRIQALSLVVTVLVVMMALRTFPRPQDQAYIICFAAGCYYFTLVATSLVIQQREFRQFKPPRRRWRHRLHSPAHPPAQRPIIVRRGTPISNDCRGTRHDRGWSRVGGVLQSDRVGHSLDPAEVAVPASSSAWVRQVNVVSKTFDHQVAGFVR